MIDRGGGPSAVADYADGSALETGEKERRNAARRAGGYHIDGDPFNNDLANLETLVSSTTARREGAGDPREQRGVSIRP